MSKYIYLDTQEIEDEIKCPYCGVRLTSSYEVLENDGDSEIIECDCGKNFVAEKCITIDYRTSKSCEDNNEQHEWKEGSREDIMVCKKCNARKY